MKKTLVFTLLVAGVCIGLYSCTSQYPMLYKKSYIESRILKDDCQRNELKSNSTIRADSLFSVATKLMKDGKDKDAYYVMELAVIHYRLAISYSELDMSKKMNKELKMSLIKAQDKLDTYKKVLSEIEAIKQ